MTPQRFESLADAHGGDVARWPAAEREAAAALMIAQPDVARKALARAAALDAALDAWPPMAVTHHLRERVIAAAPAARSRGRLAAWFWGAGLGAGLAAASAAGLAVGVTLYDVSQPDETVSAAFAGYDDLSADVTGEGA
ncbi:hypothetical protein [Phenylobacterium sp.]|uniref:hypothetical protein n=1 Tax=Phenylobacterium sp. TaxID=1871053 RepID=UPI002734E0E8|nr:hypothetical protein [Phenylobacterium sp.]MDP3853370.1 hypothetical protein [Phenylobacterium sp.]